MHATERETTINLGDADNLVRIWTAQRRHITALRKKAHIFNETGSGMYDGTEWAQFTIPASDWSPVTGVKRQVILSEEQRQRLAARARSLRAA